VTSMMARRCYRMIIVVMDDDMMSLKTVATEGHSSDVRFGDITEEPL
jgi:hypothetical protein